MHSYLIKHKIYIHFQEVLNKHKSLNRMLLLAHPSLLEYKGLFFVQKGVNVNKCLEFKVKCLILDKDIEWAICGYKSGSSLYRLLEEYKQSIENGNKAIGRFVDVSIGSEERNRMFSVMEKFRCE